jgi:hypothetical protein
MNFRRYPWIPLSLTLFLCLGYTSGLRADNEGLWSSPDSTAVAGQDTDVAIEKSTEEAKAIKCVVTGLPWMESSTRVEAIFKVDGQRLRGRFLSPVYMMIQYQALKDEGSDVEIESVLLLDFATFGTDSERMVALADDWSNVVFIASDVPLKGSKEPYYAAFSTVEDTKEGVKRLGGKVLSYEALMKRLLSALRSTDEDSREVSRETDGMRTKFKSFDPTADL